jgi:hypothetical protein
LRLTPHQSILPSNNWNIWMFTEIGRYVLTQLCQCYLEPKIARGPSPFFVGYFSLSKNFNYVAKDAKSSILSRVVAIGLTTSRLPPLHNIIPIATTITSSWLLRWRVFDILFVLIWCPLIYPSFLIPLYIFRLCGVFYK